MTLAEFRVITRPYPHLAVRRAVETVLGDAPVVSLLVHYHTAADAPDLPPPLTEAQVAAIYRHLVARANGHRPPRLSGSTGPAG